MSYERKKSQDQLLWEAEVKRLDAETKKLEEERLKIELERKELQRNANKPWFKKRPFIQTLLGALVVVPLVWFYFEVVALPLFNKENIELAWKNAVTLDSLNTAKEKLEISQTKHAQELHSYILQLEELKIEYSKVDSIKESISNEYKKLCSLHQITEIQRDSFKLQVARLQAALSNKESRIELIDNKISSAEEKLAALGYCVKCKKKTEMVDVVKVTMKNGRPALKGKCSICGTGMYKILPEE